MQYSIVHYKTVRENFDFRIDAEHFKPEYLEIIKKLKAINSVKLGDYILKISGGATPLGANYYSAGVPFLRVQNIMQNYINDNYVCISEEQNKEIKRSVLKETDVLLTITGAYGKSAVVEKRYNDANINQHSVLIRLKKGLNPYFVSTFLNCYFGKKQSDKNIVGLSRPALDYKNIKQYFLIPVLNNYFQKIIEKIVKTSHQHLSNSKSFYSQAEQILLSELGLLDWKPKQALAFVKSFSSTQGAERIDAEYFQPKYEEIINAIKKYTNGFDKLGNLVAIKKCVEPGSNAYQKTGIPFVRVSNLLKFEISTNNQQFISEDLYEKLKIHQPKQNEILLSKDATPGIAYHLKDEPIQMVPSSGILRLKIKETKVLPEYLTLVLNSVTVQKQIERNAGGSIINHWRPDQVRSTIIPVLKINKQQGIEKLIENSFENRRLSKSLLAIAKRSVEIAIEQDERIAENWIDSEVKKLGASI